jgi:hypothetical protein
MRTPFGSAVLPDVYWMKAVSSCSAAMRKGASSAEEDSASGSVDRVFRSASASRFPSSGEDESTRARRACVRFRKVARRLESDPG